MPTMAWVSWQASLGTSLAMPVSLFGEYPRAFDATRDSLNFGDLGPWSKSSSYICCKMHCAIINHIVACMEYHIMRVQDAACNMQLNPFTMTLNASCSIACCSCPCLSSLVQVVRTLEKETRCIRKHGG